MPRFLDPSIRGLPASPKPASGEPALRPDVSADVRRFFMVLVDAFPMERPIREI